MAEYDDIRNNLEDQGYEPEQESSLTGTLLGIGVSMAGFHFGMMGVQKLTRTIGSGLTRAAAGAGKSSALEGIARSIRNASSGFGGGRRLAADVRALGMQARRAVGRSAATGEPVKGMGALLRDHPRTAKSGIVEAYKRKMARPRAAINAWRKQTGGVTGDYTQRVSALKQYFAPHGLGDRVVGSTEKYMSKYLQASPAVYLTDRAFGFFEEHGDEEPAPAWWNLPGNVWDYAKFTASFLPVDMAFSGATKHGIPFLKAGAEHSVKNWMAKSGYDAKIRDWMANQFSPDAFKSKLTIPGIVGRMGAAVDAIGVGMSELSQRDPTLYVDRATGVKFEPIASGIGDRARQTLNNIRERYHNKWQERIKEMTEEADLTRDPAYFGQNTPLLEKLNTLLNPKKMDIYGPGADPATVAIVQATLAEHRQPIKGGIFSRMIGLENAYVQKGTKRWDDLQQNYPHLVEAFTKLGDGQNAATAKFYLGQGVLAADGPAGQALIDTHKWKFAAISKQLLQPLESIQIGIPFYGPKVRVGSLFASGARSLIDSKAGPYGRLPKIHQLSADEGYALPRPDHNVGQIFRAQQGDDAFYIMGQFYHRQNGKLVNALRNPTHLDSMGNPIYQSSQYFDENTQTPMVSFPGIDKAEHSRMSKLSNQQLGLFSHTPSPLFEGRKDTWEGVKRWAEVGGFARGLIGNIVDFYKHAFSRQSPRHILGDNSNLGFFQKAGPSFYSGKLNAADMKVGINELESLFREGGIASYEVFSRAGVREALSKSTSSSNPWLTFDVKGRKGLSTVKDLWNLSDKELVDTAENLYATIDKNRRSHWWSSNVRSIVSKFHMEDFDKTLRDVSSQYPRSLMGGYKKDLSGADELRNFLIHESIYRTQIKSVKNSTFSNIVEDLSKRQIIGDRAATVLRFTKKGLEWEKINEVHGSASDVLSQFTDPAKGPKNALNWLGKDNQLDTFRNMGQLYDTFARPRLDRLGDTYNPIGTESTPNLVLARWLPGAKTFQKTFLPKPGEPLSTEGAIPFYLMDRFSSVGHILGMAYDPTKTQTPGDLFKHFFRLSGIAAASMVAWDTADTFFDVNPMFDNTPLGEGLNVALGSMWGYGRIATAHVYDTIGVTDTAQYLEGLMPGSMTSPLAGAIRGFGAPIIGARVGGAKGLGIGTLVSLLTAGGPAASFGEWDITNSAEELQEMYRGDKLVPIRKGRWWELGSTSWEGNKIQYFSPHWMQRLNSQYRNTPTQFGGKLEKWLFREWPLIGINPIGYLIDPYHTERQHYLDRPYPQSAPLFDEVPFVGALLSGTLGQVMKPQVNMHPAEVNASFVDGVGWVPNSTAGVGPKFYNNSQSLQTSQAFINNSLEMRKDAPQSMQGSRQMLGSTFDRAFQQPAGLIGWQTSLLTGTPFSNTTTVANAGAITSHQRQYWDMQVGGLGGITEFVRRFMPHDVNEREAWNPIRNTMPSWLPGGAENTYHKDFKYGDPFTNMPMGELRLPGRGYESAHNVNFTFPMRASKFGSGHADQVRFFLGMDSPLQRAEEDILNRGTALHRAIQQNLARLNLLVQAEALVYDPYADVSGHVDAIIREGNRKKVLEIKTTSTEKLSRMVDAQNPHKSQLNMYMKTLGLKEGAILYVDRENPWNMKTFEYGFDFNRYQRDVNRLHASRASARQLISQGHGANLGEAYSWLDRAKILGDIAPYSNEAKDALNKAHQQINAGLMGPDAFEELEEIKRMRKAVARQYDFYPKRFSSVGDLIIPDANVNILSENEHIKAAAEYGPIERLAGAAWELLSHRDTWLHRKFLNTYDPIEHYERNVLYSRPTSFWDSPVKDFVEPTIRSLMREDDPFGGAISWGATAAMLGSNTFGGIGALAGAIWGGAHGMYKTIDDSKWIPDIIRKDREYSEYFDKIQYVKAQRMYQQTGDKKWLTVASETMTGINPYSQSKDGWTHFYRALPARERPYMDAFMKETSPIRRNEVVEMVPPAVAEALKAKWNQMDFKASQRMSDDQTAEGLTDYFRTHNLPKQGWMGWHPMINVEDVQVKTLDNEGMDAHDFNLGWMDQRRRMAHSPFLPGPVDIDDTTGESIYPENQLRTTDIRKAMSKAIEIMGLKGSVHLNIASGLLNQTRVTVTAHRNAAITSSINTVHARS